MATIQVCCELFSTNPESTATYLQSHKPSKKHETDILDIGGEIRTHL